MVNGKRGADADSTYEWELLGFLMLTEKKVFSQPFRAAGYSWRLSCFPRQNVSPWQHVSLYLEYLTAASLTPHDLLLTGSFTLTIVNHKKPELSVAASTSHDFSIEQVDWGFSQMLPLTDVSVDSGFLRKDGAMVIRLEMDAKLKKSKSDPTITTDLLALLEDPGPTSDLTLTAGGQSFPVHRAILAARSDFFKAMFASGFKDSSARELPLPETDPEALRLLLRFIYGGVLDGCSRPLLKPAAELADRLRLTGARSELAECLQSSTGPDVILDDMLWAELHGFEELLKNLQEGYLQTHAKDVDESALMTLAERSPKLMVRLHVMCLQRLKP